MPQKKVKSQGRSLANTMASYYVGGSAGFGLVMQGTDTPGETIEARLERKAQTADRTSVTALSLGQLDRAARRKLLYGG